MKDGFGECCPRPNRRTGGGGGGGGGGEEGGRELGVKTKMEYLKNTSL